MIFPDIKNSSLGFPRHKKFCTWFFETQNKSWKQSLEVNFNACNSEMCYRAPLSFRPNKWSPHIFHQYNFRNFITDTCRCFITADRLKCFHSIFPDTKSCRCCINWKIINLFLQTQFSDLIFPMHHLQKSWPDSPSHKKFLTWLFQTHQVPVDAS